MKIPSPAMSGPAEYLRELSGLAQLDALARQDDRRDPTGVQEAEQEMPPRHVGTTKRGRATGTCGSRTAGLGQPRPTVALVATSKAADPPRSRPRA